MHRCDATVVDPCFSRLAVATHEFRFGRTGVPASALGPNTEMDVLSREKGRLGVTHGKERSGT